VPLARAWDDNKEAMALAVRQEFARRSYGFTEVRILDLLILSVTAAARPGWRLTGLFPARAGKPAPSGSERTHRLGVCLPMT
jgi:hypothetical protein